MVEMMVAKSRESATTLLNSARLATGIPSKLEHLSRLNDDLFNADSSFLSEFLPQLLDLLSDRFSPVRKLVTEIIGDIGLKEIQFLPEIVPAFIGALQDGTPAVARQAITRGLNLFRCTLRKVAFQGLVTNELKESIASSWVSMLKFKERVYSIAFQPGNDGLRLPALRFVEAVILLYTVDPNGSSDPPQVFDENLVEFDISWVRGGHPLLNVGDLSIEASQSVASFLDQLRSTTIKYLSSSMLIVLINSLAAIANKRPAFYGRILPVLLGMDISSSVIKAMHIFAVRNTLKSAFLSCLKCTHPGAVPWRDRLAGALREMEVGGPLIAAVPSVSMFNLDLKEENNDFQPITKEGPSIELSHHADENKKRKRLLQNIGDLLGENCPGKRSKQTPSDSEGSLEDLNKDVDSFGQTSSQGMRDNRSVQQLVALFGAFVAQGEKAVSSLDILISSISSDLLAEVVIANMQHFPCNPEDSLLNFDLDSSIIGNDADGKLCSSFVSDILSLSRILPQMASTSDVQPSVSRDVLKRHGKVEDHMIPVVNQDIDSTVLDTSDVVFPKSKNDMSELIPPQIDDLESEIPGLNSTAINDGLSSTLIVSSLGSADFEDGSQELASSVDKSSLAEHISSVSADKSEELNLKTSVADTSSFISSTPGLVGLSLQIVLPKMSAPVISLSDELKDHLQTLAFMRIIDAYKHVSVAGGSHIRSFLLASIGVELPMELDHWKRLQDHILFDYVNTEGHDLTLCVLYRLFGEAEEQDFFSSTTATSIYETFLLTVVEALRDSFPASDKSLIRLLSEVPYLPKSVLKLLGVMCAPTNEMDEKELHGDRATQGLSAVWSLILLRPAIRKECLQIALQSAVHHSEEVRTKAIRLVANKLYPVASIAQPIEAFAKEMLYSIAIGGSKIDRVDAEEETTESKTVSIPDMPVAEPSSVVNVVNKVVFPETRASTSESISSSAISEAQRYMSLYFALCTKKHSLFREIFVVYKHTSEAVKQAVIRHIQKLVSTMGSSPELLEIVSDPPTGSEMLLVQVLHTLTDGIIPSPAVTSAIKKLYDTKLKDVDILIPILPFLPKEEVMHIFPHIVNLPREKFQATLARAMQGSSASSPEITPADILFSIHGIDPSRDGIPLKKVTDACNVCFDQPQIFTQQVIAVVLGQLVEQNPLPLLFMRTVIQAIGAFPTLVDFIMNILSRLIGKQIWKYPKLWVGFLKCMVLTSPQSYNVLLQLPSAVLENALAKSASLKAPLIAHATQPHVQSKLPRAILGVLGIGQDSQAQQATQSQGANSDKEMVVASSTGAT